MEFGAKWQFSLFLPGMLAYNIECIFLALFPILTANLCQSLTTRDYCITWEYNLIAALENVLH